MMRKTLTTLALVGLIALVGCTAYADGPEETTTPKRPATGTALVDLGYVVLPFTMEQVAEYIAVGAETKDAESKGTPYSYIVYDERVESLRVTGGRTYTTTEDGVDVVAIDTDEDIYGHLYYPIDPGMGEIDFDTAQHAVRGPKGWRFVASGPEEHHDMEWEIRGVVNDLFHLEQMAALEMSGPGQFSFLLDRHEGVADKAQKIHESRHLGYYSQYPAQAHAHKTVKTAWDAEIAECKADDDCKRGLTEYSGVMGRLAAELTPHEPEYRWDQKPAVAPSQ